MEEFARSSGLSNGRMGPVTQVQTRKDRRISQQPILSQKGQLFDLHLTHLRLQWEPPVLYESSYFSGCCNNNIFGPVIIKWCHLAGRKKRFKNVPCHAGLLSEGLNYRNRRNRWRSAIFFQVAPTFLDVAQLEIEAIKGRLLDQLDVKTVNKSK